MTSLSYKQLIAAQHERLQRFGASQFVDVHCHCLPGLDDGPTSMSEAIVLCEMLVADGVTTVIATPHQLGRFEGCYGAQQIREAVGELNYAMEKRGIPLKIAAGADVRLDERIPQLLGSGQILTLGDTGRYILLELPHETFINPQPLITQLDSLGLRTVISHPERNVFLAKNPSMVLKWAELGACLQITAASLVGDFGPLVRDAAWYFLNSGWAAFVATDSHNINARRPRMKAAFERISANFNEHIARQLCIENPSRVVNGQDVLPVPVHNLVETNR
jgi:protein-tyrosine phosphatase